MKLIGLFALLLLLSSCAAKNIAVQGLPSPEQSPKNKEATVLVMTERVFNFAPNSSELEAEDQKSFQTIISDILKNQKKYHRIEIIGHSDQTGTEDDNLDISKERALAILEAMKDSGIDRKKIRTSWLAGTEPVEEARESSVNRRVEIRLFVSKNNF
ncbi:MAG: OmpA family protein [Bdellovibrionota bacterium]